MTRKTRVTQQARMIHMTSTTFGPPVSPVDARSALHVPNRRRDPDAASTIAPGLTLHRRARGSRLRHGFTLVDVSVVIAALVMLVAVCLPVLTRSRSESGQVLSMMNLQSLAFVHSLYGSDWSDRQVTWVPDDAGIYTTLFGGTNWVSAYTTGGGCPPPMLLGWSQTDSNPIPTLWGYFVGCGGTSGSSANAAVLAPLNFVPTAPTGSFRLMNASATQGYLDGRFYSPAFYAPNDELTWELAEPLFDLPVQFNIVPPYGSGGIPSTILSSYCLSPAAMYDPEVFGKNPQNGQWWSSPNSYFLGYRSPTVSHCLHPDLKTRMLEHNWNLGAPAPANPAVAGGYTPYQFNHGLAASPLALFFDGHVAELPTAQAVADDAMVLSETRGEVGLWTRDTPFGALGYQGGISFDGTLASHHILTTDGILGRDVLNVAAPPLAVGGHRGTSIRRVRPWMATPEAMVVK